MDSIDISIQKKALFVGKTSFEWEYRTFEWSKRFSACDGILGKKWGKAQDLIASEDKARKEMQDTTKLLCSLPKGVACSWTSVISFLHSYKGRTEEVSERPKCTRDSHWLYENHTEKCILHVTEEFTQPLFDQARERGYIAFNLDDIDIVRAQLKSPL